MFSCGVITGNNNYDAKANAHNDSILELLAFHIIIAHGKIHIIEPRTENANNNIIDVR